jgi:RNA polymerase sigma-70 factor (ECF subfamily)
MQRATVRSPEAEEVEQLATAAARGDEKAMSHLYERYVDAIYRHVFVKTRGNHADTEDLCADVWVRVVRSIDRYETAGNGFPAWLYTIANNVVKSHYRSRACRPETPTAEMFHLDSPSIEVSPEEAALRRSTSEEVADLLRSLSPAARQCVVHRLFEGLSVAETAEVMGQSAGWVKTTQHRALKKVAKILPPEMRCLGSTLSVSHVQAVGAASAVAR